MQPLVLMSALLAPVMWVGMIMSMLVHPDRANQRDKRTEQTYLGAAAAAKLDSAKEAARRRAIDAPCDVERTKGSTGQAVPSGMRSGLTRPPHDASGTVMRVVPAEPLWPRKLYLPAVTAIEKRKKY